jgi:hypothetical protein
MQHEHTGLYVPASTTDHTTKDTTTHPAPPLGSQTSEHRRRGASTFVCSGDYRSSTDHLYAALVVAWRSLMVLNRLDS